MKKLLSLCFVCVLLVQITIYPLHTNASTFVETLTFVTQKSNIVASVSDSIKSFFSFFFKRGNEQKNTVITTSSNNEFLGSDDESANETTTEVSSQEVAVLTKPKTEIIERVVYQVDNSFLEARLLQFKRELLQASSNESKNAFSVTTFEKQIDKVYSDLSKRINELEVATSTSSGISNGDSANLSTLTVATNLLVTDEINNNVGIGTSSPYAKLSVAGTIVGANFIGTTTATSTLGGGMNITSGCYAINGTCLSSSGSGSGTVNSGTLGQIAFYNASGTAVSGTSSVSIASSGDVSFAGDVINLTGVRPTITTSNTNGASQELTINTYNGGSGSSGELQIYTGDAPNFGGSGALSFYTGNGKGMSGSASLITGDVTGGSGSSGSVNIHTGQATSTGDVYIFSGNGVNAGDVDISAGSGSVTNGNVLLNGGGLTGKVLLNTTGGNVGIGTSSPFAKLSVNGNMVNVGHAGFGNKARVDASYIWPSDPMSTALSVKEEATNLSLNYVRGIDTELLLKPSTAPVGGFNAVGGSFYVITDFSVAYDFPDTIRGLSSEASHNGSGYANYLMGNETIAFNNNGGSVGSADGLWAQVTNSGSGSIDYATGVDVFLSNLGTGTITDAYGVYVYPTENSGGGTIENNYGLFIANQSGVGTVDSFNIYSSGSDSLNYFSGKVGIGTTSPYAKLSVTGTIVAQNIVATSTAATSTFAGYVGIGTTTPAFPLDVYRTILSNQTYGFLNPSGTTGTATGVNSYSIRAQGRIMASEFNAVSDARLKDVQFELSDDIALNAINDLRPVSFTWKDNPTGQPVLGLLAQEVEIVIPNAVSQINSGKYTDQRELSYNQIVAVMIGAIKSLTAKVENILAWFDGDGSKMTVQGDICVDDVCISKEQFKALIQSAGQSSNNNPSSENNNQQTPPVVETSTTTSTSTPALESGNDTPTDGEENSQLEAPEDTQGETTSPTDETDESQEESTDSEPTVETNPEPTI